MAGIYAIVAFFGGIFICGVAAFCWYILTVLRELKASIDLQAKTTQELLGEGSFTRISKALTTLNGAVPDILHGITEFAGVMRMVFEANQETKPPAKNAVIEDSGSGFYAHSDQGAAINEVAEEARRQKIFIPPEDLVKMHTDEAT
ncbi:MAG: hypothetical protein WA734_13945 [Candidatus Acidiferrales bacterium]